MNVMEKWWTMTALPQLSPEELVCIASNLTQTLYQCLRTPGQFECDWGTQWTWHWQRRPIGSHGSMTHYRGVYGLCFLHLIQHRPLKALIGVQMCPFSSICFVCSYRVAKISSCQISHSSRLEVCSALTGNITLVMPRAREMEIPTICHGLIVSWRCTRLAAIRLVPDVLMNLLRFTELNHQPCKNMHKKTTKYLPVSPLRR